MYVSCGVAAVVSVGGEVTLPNQPASPFTAVSSVQEIPLAGNGYTAPHSAWAVFLELEGDVSGGTMSLTCTLDNKWSHLLAWSAAKFATLADEKRISYNVQVYEDLEYFQNQIYKTSFGQLNQEMWCPPPQMLVAPGAPDWTNSILLSTDNTDTEDLRWNLLIYNFKKDANKVVPLPILHSVLSRAASSA